MNDTFDSVWDAISSDPDEAEHMKLRASLSIAIRDHIARNGWRQREASEHFGVSQPRISELKRGRIDQFSLDALVSMATAGGLHVEMTIAEPA